MTTKMSFDDDPTSLAALLCTGNQDEEFLMADYNEIIP